MVPKLFVGGRHDLFPWCFANILLTVDCCSNTHASANKIVTHVLSSQAKKPHHVSTVVLFPRHPHPRVTTILTLKEGTRLFQLILYRG